MRATSINNWLDENIDKVKVFDASWHFLTLKEMLMKNLKRIILKTLYFFDIDKNSNKNSILPHMLTTEKDWEKILSNLV